MEVGIFSCYEKVFTLTEQLLLLKKAELKAKLEDSKHAAMALLGLPILLTIFLLFFSRMFLKRAIVKPIKDILHATSEISSGHSDHKVPEMGAAELATLSQAINKMAEELSLSQDALVGTEKQAPMGLLVPILAHNIRNPLASILATAQVTDSPKLDPDTRESLQGIISTVDRLERWTGSLLAYLHPIKAQQGCYQQSIARCHRTFTTKTARKIIQTKVTTIPTPFDVFLTDEHLSEQALYNLLLNEIDASPKTVIILLKVDFTGSVILITINDQGSGMPFTPDPHTISPGPTTKRFTSLGIPFAFKVCEVLAGNLQFRPNLQCGTEVLISLPRA